MEWFGLDAVIFDDGVNNTSRKQGKILELNESYVTIRTDRGDETIPMARVVRIERGVGSRGR